MPSIDIDFNEKCYTPQQRDQLQRLLMKKQDLELAIDSMKHQVEQLTQTYTNLGITQNMLDSVESSQILGVVINLVGVSPIIKDLDYVKRFVREQRDSINHQLITVKRNILMEKKNLWELDSKILDIYNRAHNTNIQMGEPTTKKRKKIYKEADEEINPEISRLEKELEKELR